MARLRVQSFSISFDGQAASDKATHVVIAKRA
jgi:hypothetical protein